MSDAKRFGDVRAGSWILAAGLLLLAPAAAGAQELAPPRLTISAGYQFMSDPSWDTYLKLGWVGTVTQKQVEDIAKTKMPDLNCDTLESAVKTVAGTARSMGLDVIQ